MFKNKTLLITGGTGSFGHQVLRRFLQSDVSEIRIFSRDEKKQEEMRMSFNNTRLRFYIGDVRDIGSVNRAMKGADYVFHAAALKQVPSCEFYPLEAIKTNALGADNVMESAVRNGVRKVVCLSTDKAVYPINAMGHSKALMEKLMVSRARAGQGQGETVFCATRYGNVMASRGSVIPLFVSQLKAGGQLTITDPEMTRFLMSLDESVDLVMHAYEKGEQGDLFVQKSPSCTIGNLAMAIMEIFNKVQPTIAMGTRHGEKLYETLVSREELTRSIEDDRYFKIPMDARDLNYNLYLNEGELRISSQYDYTSHSASRLTVEEIKYILLKLDYIQGELN